MKHAIETAIQAATGLKGKVGEKREEYFRRLSKGLADLSQDAWDALPKEVQEWHNTGVKARKAGKDTPGFADAAAAIKQSEAVDAKDAKAEGEAEEPSGKKGAAKKAAKKTAKPKTATKSAPKTAKKAAKKTAKSGGDGAATKTATKKAPKEKAEKKAKVSKDDGVRFRTKELVLKTPDISSKAILEKLQAEGFKPNMNTVRGTAAEFRHSIGVLVKHKKMDAIGA